MAQPLGMPNDVAVYLGFINQMMIFPGQVFQHFSPTFQLEFTMPCSY
jgi:hypothetical protein